MAIAVQVMSSTNVSYRQLMNQTVEWKKIYYKHTQPFRNKKYEKSTEAGKFKHNAFPTMVYSKNSSSIY